MPSFPDHFFTGSYPVVLVAGGAGFIGSHLCEKLLDKNVRVICVDNWLTGVKENISHLRGNSNFFLLEYDIGKPLPKNIKKVDYVVHLAGVEAYLNGEDVSIETLEANSVGTKNLLEFAEEKKARFLLVSTINVFSAKISATDTADYFGPNRVFEGEFSHHEAKRFAEALTSEHGQKHGADVRIVRLTDVYGPRMMLSGNRPLGNLIKQTIYGGPLKIPGGEELTLYPIFIDDVVSGIAKALFSSGTKNKIISLSGPRMSAFALAQTIKSVVENNPQLRSLLRGRAVEIEFTDNDFPQLQVSEEILTAGRDVISWRAETSIEKGLVETFRWFLKNKARVPKEKRETQKSTRGFWENVFQKPKTRLLQVSFKGKLPLVLLLLLVLFWFFFWPFVQAGGAAAQITFSKNSLLSGDTSRAKLWSRSSYSWAKGAEASFIRWGSLPGLKNEAAFLSQKAKILVRAALVAKRASLVADEFKVLMGGVLGSEPFDAQVPADKLALELSALEQDISFLEAEIGGEDLTVNFPFLPAFKISRTFDFSEIKKVIAGVSGILEHASELLGRDGKRTYLVLLQNNMELRPTGGFIGSFALLTFDKGRFIGLEVLDVYTADGQLKGHVEPPKPIREHLGEASWFLRDSNWDPDFPTSAAKAAWFIDKELGQTVNGIIGIDLEFAKELVRYYGPIRLADFNEEVTSENLYEKTQYAVEGEFFPGSRAKKNFLTALARELLGKVLVRDEEISFDKLVPAAKALFSALEGRHMALWVRNQEVMSELRKVGWDGGVRNVRCQDSACIPDYLMVVEANLGVNKANYFLDRSYSLEATVEGEAILHQLTLSYKNRSDGNNWPGGDYKNYLRIFVPREAELVSARLINTESGKGEYLTTEEEVKGDKKSIGILAPVPAGKTRQVVISWKLPLAKIVDEQELVFLWQKQLGTPADPLWFLLRLPQEGKITSTFPASSLTTSSSVGYNTELSEDLLFNIRWQTQP